MGLLLKPNESYCVSWQKRRAGRRPANLEHAACVRPIVLVANRWDSGRAIGRQPEVAFGLTKQSLSQTVSPEVSTSHPHAFVGSYEKPTITVRELPRE